MKILITICARGGSKGIPQKNIKLLDGHPLIAYTINIAKKFSENVNAKIALSTDDDQIKFTAEKYGVFTDYERPEYLSTDSAGKIETIHDLIIHEEGLLKDKFDFILDLDVSSPLRNILDLEKSYSSFQNSEALSLFSVNKSSRNPYFNMVEEKKNGFYNLISKLEQKKFKSRQTAPKTYDLNASLYWYRRIFFDGNRKTPFTDKSIIYEMPHICFDLDEKIDFVIMEHLMKTKNLGFEL